MKKMTYRQLQLRLFLGLLFLFSSAIIGYRFFIEQPQLESSVAKISQRELTSISLFSKKSLSSLQALVYDYGVWDSTYKFVQDFDEEFINENFIDDTFISLKIDGVYIFNKDLKLIYGIGFHHEKEETLNFDFYIFDKYPKNKLIVPENKSMNNLMSNFGGVISTKYGPALFSSQSIKMSDKSGNFVGFIMFLYLMEETYYKQLEEVSFAKINANIITSDQYEGRYLDWFSPQQLQKVVPYSYRTIHDINDTPLVNLQIKHSNGALPPLIDTKTLIYITVFAGLIFYILGIVSAVVIKPIKKLADDIKKMDGSDKLSLLEENRTINELHDVSRHFNKLVNTVQAQNNLLNNYAYIDPLTHIYNRRALEDKIEQNCQLFIREKIGFTLILIDVDHFKLFNDSLGHIEGDNALVKVAKILKKCCKRVNDMCARYGGEEFVLLLSNISTNDLTIFLNKLQDDFKTLNLKHPTSPIEEYLTVSLGACVVDYPDREVKELAMKSIIRNADKALYQAKHRGRNCFNITPFYESNE